MVYITDKKFDAFTCPQAEFKIIPCNNKNFPFCLLFTCPKCYKPEAILTSNDKLDNIILVNEECDSCKYRKTDTKKAEPRKF